MVQWMVYIPSIDGKIGDTAPAPAPSALWAEAEHLERTDKTLHTLQVGRLEVGSPTRSSEWFFQKIKAHSKLDLIQLDESWWIGIDGIICIYILYIVSCVLKSERMAFWGISSSTTWRLTIKIMKVTETKASWTHEGLVLSRKNTWVHHISSLVHPQIHHESMMNPSWNWAKIWAPPGESPTVAGCPSSHGGGGRQSPRGAEARAEAAPAKRGFCTFRWKVKYGSLGNSWTKWL